MQTASAPPLEPHCGSWVVTLKDGRIFETFSRRVALTAAQDGHTVETALQYLARFNREVAA